MAVRPTILVVDDHEDGREVLAVIVASCGYTVLTAGDGQEAIDRAKEAKPAAIIMDLFMPGMDGYEAARILKSDEALAAIPILAYTARSSPADLDTRLFDACCIKPCPPDQLLHTLARLLATPTPR